jgi:DNA-binding XRE family transcriptional regulator
MQIKIRYAGGKPEAPKELIKLLSQAGYAIETGAETDGKASISTKGKHATRGQRRPRAVVMTPTGHPLAGADKLSTSRARAVNLRTLRESAGKTQAEIARRTGMSQPQLSRLESRKDHLISTLRKYVRALGGEIEVVASIGGKRALLRDV